MGGASGPRTGRPKSSPYIWGRICGRPWNKRSLGGKGKQAMACPKKPPSANSPNQFLGPRVWRPHGNWDKGPAPGLGRNKGGRAPKSPRNTNRRPPKGGPEDPLVLGPCHAGKGPATGSYDWQGGRRNGGQGPSAPWAKFSPKTEFANPLESRGTRQKPSGPGIYAGSRNLGTPPGDRQTAFWPGQSRPRVRPAPNRGAADPRPQGYFPLAQGLERRVGGSGGPAPVQLPPGAVDRESKRIKHEGAGPSFRRATLPGTKGPGRPRFGGPRPLRRRDYVIS